MAGPDSDGTLRELAERLVLAGFGAVALTRERIDILADELSRRGALGKEEAREVIDDAVRRWRGDAVRFGRRAGSGLQGFARDVGFATQEELSELELRVAQLEHRLRLLEGEPLRREVEPPRAVQD
jgi:polyhydroxyalkanoate synthesis regulator phasin